jgi:hypothetical protein
MHNHCNQHRQRRSWPQAIRAMVWGVGNFLAYIFKFSPGRSASKPSPVRLPIKQHNTHYADTHARTPTPPPSTARAFGSYVAHWLPHGRTPALPPTSSVPPAKSSDTPPGAGRGSPALLQRPLCCGPCALLQRSVGSFPGRPPVASRPSPRKKSVKRQAARQVLNR